MSDRPALRAGQPAATSPAPDASETPAIEELVTRGQALAGVARLQEAAGAFFAGTLLAPDHAECHLRLALCLQRLRQWEDALKHFQRARVLDPSNGDALLGLGTVSLELRRAEQALEAFNAVTGPERNAALLGKAVALQMLERHQEADAAYREVLRFQPDSEDALGNLIALCMKRADRSGAEQHAKQLLAIRPGSRIALEALVSCAIGAGEYETAARYCARIIEIDPQSMEAWANLKFCSQQMLATLKGTPAPGPGGERRKPGV